ncbi:hypothetical protein H9Q69_002792 [Fusarium xylarioides]|nr:hypothetical protein H9Q69_002792 [Fusarium xylarioides]
MAILCEARPKGTKESGCPRVGCEKPPKRNPCHHDIRHLKSNCLAGDYTTSPALGSAPRIAAKVAYGLVLPCVFATAMAFGHTGIKYMYVVAMRSIKATHQVTDRSFKSWGI